MAIDPKTVFNTEFPAGVKGELDRRKALASGVNRTEDFKKWNYKRYCFVSVATTGVNALGKLICSSVMTIGDGSINKKAGLDLYEDEGGIRKNLPILKSVTLDSDGSSNATQATMWTAKVEFDLFTLSQLNRAEKSFLRQGSIVKLDFGWRGEADASNEGFIEGEVVNFAFSASSFEMIGANASFSAANLEGSPAMTPAQLAQAKEAAADPLPPYPSIARSIMLQHEEAFGLEPGDDYGDDQAEDGKI